MILSGKARLAGVLGWPVAHSRSPRLHGYWLERHEIDGAYLPLPVRPEDLELALSALPKLGFSGCNLTVPHKESALRLCDALDPVAEAVGAVNTLIVHDGRLHGTNTDVFGFAENIRRGAPDWDAAAGPAVVLGAGGAARAVLVALQRLGVPEVRVLNRTQGRAEALVEGRGNAGVFDWGDWRNALEEANLLVNTTSLGMTGQPSLEIDLSRLPAGALVNDIVYAPLETKLLAEARRRGNPAVDGLGMLLYQAQAGFEAWFGVKPEVTAALRDFVLEE